MDNHVFLTIFTAYQCKVHRVVARKVHPSLLGVGKNYAWATKFPHAYCAETPVRFSEVENNVKEQKVPI